MPRKPTNGGLAQAVRAKRNGMSFRAAAKEVPCVHSVIQFTEKGRIPQPGVWLKLLKYIGVINDKEYERLRRYAE